MRVTLQAYPRIPRGGKGGDHQLKSTLLSRDIPSGHGLLFSFPETKSDVTHFLSWMSMLSPPMNLPFENAPRQITPFFQRSASVPSNLPVTKCPFCRAMSGVHPLKRYPFSSRTPYPSTRRPCSHLPLVTSLPSTRTTTYP